MFSKKEQGFNLIELSIVIGIMGVLAAIAYPMYQNYLFESRKKTAIKTLYQIMAKEKNYFSRHYNYASNWSDLDLTSATYSDDGYYKITREFCTPSPCILLKATPIGIQALKAQGVIALSSMGQKIGDWPN